MKKSKRKKNKNLNLKIKIKKIDLYQIEIFKPTNDLLYTINYQ